MCDKCCVFPGTLFYHLCVCVWMCVCVCSPFPHVTHLWHHTVASPWARAGGRVGQKASLQGNSFSLSRWLCFSWTPSWSNVLSSKVLVLLFLRVTLKLWRWVSASAKVRVYQLVCERECVSIDQCLYWLICWLFFLLVICVKNVKTMTNTSHRAAAVVFRLLHLSDRLSKKNDLKR